ncbi:MAG: SpoIIE family protein phosphatase [Acidimicrobiia bacterium]
MPGDRFLELAMAQDRHVLEVLFGDAREAVTVQDRSETLIYANDRAAELVGFTSGTEMIEARGSDLVDRFEIVDETGQPLLLDSLPGRRVLKGLDPTEITIGYRPKGSGKTRWSRLNASPIKNDAGEVVWAINFFLDISEHVRQQEVERMLQRITTLLTGTPLSGKPDFAALADVVVPELASWCKFHLLDEFDDLVAAATAVPESADGRSLLHLAYPPSTKVGPDQIQSRVFSSGQSEHIATLTNDLLEEAEDRLGLGVEELAQRSGLKSVVCVPLGVPGTPLGTMTLVRTENEPSFDTDDLALINAVAERIGLALANSVLFGREHETAEALRRGLVPSSIPGIPGLEIATRYEPLAHIGQVGGDFFDFVVVDDDRYGIVVGDIEGKGVPAAAAVAMARSALRTVISLEPKPSVVLDQLNKTMRAEPEPRMCTIAYMLLDRKDDHFTASVTLAGHPPPLLYRADGTVALLGKPCPPAGVLESLDPKPSSFDLHPGDVVVLYTDGIARRDLPPPETVVSLGPCRTDEPLEAFLDRALDKFRSEVPTVRDDVILIAIRVLATGPDPTTDTADGEFESRSEKVPSLSMASVTP